MSVVGDCLLEVVRVVVRLAGLGEFPSPDLHLRAAAGDELCCAVALEVEAMVDVSAAAELAAPVRLHQELVPEADVRAVSVEVALHYVRVAVEAV